MALLAAGTLAGLFTNLADKAVTGIRSLITNARVGKTVLASGATVQTTQSGSTVISQPTPGGMPGWLMPVAIIGGGVLLVMFLFKFLFGRKR